ncbi:MAG: hypothetical protein K9G62_00850 [Alphaproteobacteria bacterium]|nr:hypothetical protein [Alphaproteobacteria bacterium]
MKKKYGRNGFSVHLLEGQEKVGYWYDVMEAGARDGSEEDYKISGTTKEIELRALNLARKRHPQVTDSFEEAILLEDYSGNLAGYGYSEPYRPIKKAVLRNAYVFQKHRGQNCLNILFDAAVHHYGQSGYKELAVKVNPDHPAAHKLVEEYGLQERPKEDVMKKMNDSGELPLFLSIQTNLKEIQNQVDQKLLLEGIPPPDAPKKTYFMSL